MAGGVEDELACGEVQCRSLGTPVNTSLSPGVSAAERAAVGDPLLNGCHRSSEFPQLR